MNAIAISRVAEAIVFHFLGGRRILRLNLFKDIFLLTS